MRKNSARKWLHATLDLLPVLLIPVFMIYSHRHSLTERTEVDIQYKYESNEVNNVDDVISGNVYHLNINNTTLDNYFRFDGNMEFEFNILYCYNYDFDNYALDLDDYVTINNDFGYSIVNVYTSSNGTFFNTYFTNVEYFTSLSTDNLGEYSFTLNCIIELLSCNGLLDYEIFTYTDYNVIESVDVQDTNSNIMSVFMDNFNSTISTYFNLGNVFNMGDVYKWFNTNIFGGNAPAVIYSVYNIIVYEFLMDMLFLLYGVFMFLIDFVESLMDRVFTKTRNGGR